ncbi:MAG TPA: NAD-dependent epimerase/dehydratase family protein [Candidatus Angelobacter sp.]|nr:NAD-dependent epimerase/dehydratase family protein [Candidatus Angelobacter sp.]
MNLPILITGGCGFVGRHVVQYILNHDLTDDIWLIDNLFTGRNPEDWLALGTRSDGVSGRVCSFRINGTRIRFIRDDVRRFFSETLDDERARQWRNLGAVIHLASVVGGRSLIDGDPLLVATDLSIDAEMFHWASVVRPERILYASSSAVYPIHLQGINGAVPLKEGDVEFAERIGLPDMTYGWSKLTGEYLSKVAARHYGLQVSCVRPFSGYGEDQETVYPVPAIAERVARKEDPLVVWGTGEQARDFVHIDDCVEMIFRAMETIRDGSGVNIGSGVLTRFLDVARIFSEIANYSPVIQPQIDKPTGVQNRYADTTVLSQRFHWKPSISIKEGFSRVYESARRRVVNNERFRIAYEDSHSHHHN